MIFCNNCGAAIVEYHEGCPNCGSSADTGSRYQRNTVLALIIFILLTVATYVGFAFYAKFLNMQALNDVSDDSGYREVVSEFMNAMFLTGDAEAFCDAIYPGQLKKAADKKGMSLSAFKKTLKEQLAMANADVKNMTYTISSDNYDLTGAYLDNYAEEFASKYQVTVDAVKGVELKVNIEMKDGGSYNETLGLVLVHTRNRWYVNFDDLII